MSFQNPNQWARTISGQEVGFHYEPGSWMKANSVEAEHLIISGSWSRMRRDAVKVATSKFGGDLEVSTKRPGEVL